MLRALSALLALSAAAAKPSSEKGSVPFHASAVAPESKVQLILDPLAYRSASQGPIMPAELEPTTKAQYDEIEAVIERATRTHGWQPIIPQYKRSFQWAWQQWEGTIVERLWKNAGYNMLVPLALLVFSHWSDPTTTARHLWKMPKDHTLFEPLTAIAAGWNYLLTLATFVTTFFVGHSHDFWRKSYGLTRSVQGRLNDIGLVCASHAQRGVDGGLTDEAKQLLEDTARNLRLMHCLVRRTAAHTAEAARRTP